MKSLIKTLPATFPLCIPTIRSFWGLKVTRAWISTKNWPPNSSLNHSKDPSMTMPFTFLLSEGIMRWTSNKKSSLTTSVLCPASSIMILSRRWYRPMRANTTQAIHSSINYLQRVAELLSWRKQWAINSSQTTSIRYRRAVRDHQ